jgi:hypothetical protein
MPKKTYSTEVRTIPLTKLKPYWRNPRNNIKAIQVVKRSIELYGYNQYIVVDKKLVIVAGHTRYKALMELGYDEAEVIVALDMPDQKAKEYRIADNKTNEFAEWNEDLKIELREIEDLGIMQEFFSENLQDLIQKTVWANDIKTTELEGVQESLDNKFTDSAINDETTLAEVTCPECFNKFYIKKDSFQMKKK